MTVEELQKLIVQNKTPYFKVYDLQGNLLFTYLESDNVASTSDMLGQWMPTFSGYGRVKVYCATEAMKKNNFTGCFRFDVTISSAAPVQSTGQPVQQQSFMNNMRDMMQLMQLMQGFNQPRYDMQIEMMRKEMQHERELKKLQEGKDDPMKWLAPLAPIGMKMLGWKQDEIQSTLQMAAQSSQFMNQQQPSNISGGPSLHTDSDTWTMDKAKGMTADQLTSEIQKVLNRLNTKISGEHFLVLLSILESKPELAAKAINLHQNGMI